jgi:hypothetical protein
MRLDELEGTNHSENHHISMNFFRRSISLAALCLLTGVAATAQDQQQPSQPPEPQGQAPTIRVEVREVPVYFVVKDKKGTLVPSLTKDAFQVVEDGKPQSIKSFRADTDRPLTPAAAR